MDDSTKGIFNKLREEIKSLEAHKEMLIGENEKKQKLIDESKKKLEPPKTNNSNNTIIVLTRGIKSEADLKLFQTSSTYANIISFLKRIIDIR